jgi:hypothetical protein
MLYQYSYAISIVSIHMEDEEFHEFSSLTVRGYRHRTTVPKGIFDKLGLKDKDKLLWTLLEDGTITIIKIPSLTPPNKIS